MRYFKSTWGEGIAIRYHHMDSMHIAFRVGYGASVAFRFQEYTNITLMPTAQEELI